MRNVEGLKEFSVIRQVFASPDVPTARVALSRMAKSVERQQVQGSDGYADLLVIATRIR
jgi:hypothetical protein